MATATVATTPAAADPNNRGRERTTRTGQRALRPFRGVARIPPPVLRRRAAAVKPQLGSGRASRRRSRGEHVRRPAPRGYAPRTCPTARPPPGAASLDQCRPPPPLRQD